MAELQSSQPVVAVSTDPPVVVRNRGVIGILVISAAVLAIGVPVATAVLLGEAPYDQLFRSFPGLDVAVITTLLHAGAEVGCLVSIGSLVHLLFLRGVSAKRIRYLDQVFELTVLRVAAGVWAFCAGGLVVYRALDVSGLTFSRLAEPGAFAYLYEFSDAPRAWTISFVAGMIVFFAAYFANRWTGLLIPLWASALAALAPVVTGQVLVGPDHDFGSDVGIFQTLVVNVFFGAVAVAAIRLASGRLVDPVTLRRLFLIGIVALPVIVITDLVLAWFKLAGSGLTNSFTGSLIIIRWVTLALVFVAASLLVRIQRNRRLSEHRIGTALAIFTFAVAGWVGITVAMTRQPPPQYFVPTSIQQVFMGFEVPDPPTLAVLFGQWRPNLLFLGIALAAITVYLVAVRTLHKRGDRWPFGRTLSWLLGWTVVVFVTSSGFGKYSASDFGVHMIVHMSLNMLAPALLVLGGIVTLLLRASRSRPGAPAGLHDWLTGLLHWPVLRLVYNPFLVFVVFIASYYALYFTPIFGDFMRFHWAHQAMNLHFLIVGYLYYGLIIGVDRPPRPLPHIGKLGYVLAAMPFHAFFGIILMTSASSNLIAENFYRYLDLPWANLEAQQYFGGGVAWAGGEFPLLIVIIVLALQWSRQDAKEARRKDRHFDTGRDAEVDVYNEMLQRLSEREAHRPLPTQGGQARREPNE